jgi:hypothetical protein
MRRLHLILLLLASLPAPATLAATVASIDQSHEFPGGYASVHFAAAQVFTVGRSGILERVEIPVHLLPDATPDSVASFFVSLLRTEDNDGILTNLNADRVAIKSFNAPLAGPAFNAPFPMDDFQWVALENLALPVKVGDQFAVAVNMDNAPGQNADLNWIATFPGQEYAGGKPWTLSSLQGGFSRRTDIEDFAFRTSVSPLPEPAALSLTAVGIGVLMTALRRRK